MIVDYQYLLSPEGHFFIFSILNVCNHQITRYSLSHSVIANPLSINGCHLSKACVKMAKPTEKIICSQLHIHFCTKKRKERRIKTESARTSSSCWTKLCTKIIYTLLQAFVLLLQISYQKKSFLTTPNIENQSRSSAEFH